ncbi:MAG: hypothetical protein U1F52_13920 [Burkholderiales bacterium]
MNGLPRLEGWLARRLRRAAEGNGFLGVCAVLALGGTISGTYPVTAVVVPAALLAARRWRGIAMAAAFGSAVGATVLVVAFHFLGWKLLHGAFPEMAAHVRWREVVDWVAQYGAAGLFVLALSPLPQTPALVFFGIARHDYAVVFLAMFAGKLLKYGGFGWAASRFPEWFRGEHGTRRAGPAAATTDSRSSASVDP